MTKHAKENMAIAPPVVSPADSMHDAKNVIPLDYATPLRQLRTQQMLRKDATRQVIDGNLPPEPAPNRLVLWLIFFSLFAVALILLIMLHQ